MRRIPLFPLVLTGVCTIAQTPSKALCQAVGLCDHKCTGEHKHRTSEPIPCCFTTFNVEVKQERRRIDCVFRGGKLDIPGKPMEYCCSRFIHSHILFAPLESPGSAGLPAVDPTSLTASKGFQIAISGVYLQNRLLNRSEVTHTTAPVSHTFVFTVLEDGSIGATYSWGNRANTRGWNKNAPEDISAANEALQGKVAMDIAGPPSLIPFVEQAFLLKAKPELEHKNLIVDSNCKTEAADLLKVAHALKSKS